MERQDYGMAFMLQYENVAWYEDGKVRILDRRIYPTRTEFVACTRHEEVAQAIADMVTQSAGPYTAAGMGMALAAYECRGLGEKEQIAYLEQASVTLSTARPTTRIRMAQITDGCVEAGRKALQEGASNAVDAIFQRTLDSLNRRYSRMDIVATHLVSLFPQRGTVMTQCFGETIVGTMLRKIKEVGKEIKLFVPETRPYFQGARLTASCAIDQGFDTTVITDNMPAAVMAEKGVDVFTSAADVITMDGYVVNKVGTYQIAISAKYHGIPYFVTGLPDKIWIRDVKIEERDPQEVLEARGIRNTKEGIKGYYPAFDKTPPHLVSGVVTDKGVYTPYNLSDYYTKGTVEQYY